MNHINPSVNHSTPAKTICVIFGTRPEVIKLAPVITRLRNSQFQTTVVHTGQHTTLTEDLTNYFGLDPLILLDRADANDEDSDNADTNDIGSAHKRMANNVLDSSRSMKNPSESTDIGQVLGLMRLVSRFLETHSPDLVLVQGDTASALAGAMAAHYMKIPVAHLEAGLRSHDRSQPFPEETNRILISQLADLHFAPTTTAAEQLILAQVNPKSVYVTGNSVVDALHTILNQVKTSAKETHQNYTAGYSKLAVLTTHRRENLGDPQRRILQAVVDLARQHPDLRILWPVHPNPAIRAVLDLFDLPANFQTLPPLSYVDFIPLLNACDLVLTDSGGIQEEAPALGVPVVVLREKTERPEVIDAGYGVLAGSDPEKIRAGAEHFLQQRFSATPATLYGNGTTSEQVLKILIDHFAT